MAKKSKEVIVAVVGGRQHDVVKMDGKYLHLADGRKLRILDTHMERVRRNHVEPVDAEQVERDTQTDPQE